MYVCMRASVCQVTRLPARWQSLTLQDLTVSWFSLPLSFNLVHYCDGSEGVKLCWATVQHSNPILTSIQGSYSLLLMPVASHSKLKLMKELRLHPKRLPIPFIVHYIL